MQSLIEKKIRKKKFFKLKKPLKTLKKSLQKYKTLLEMIANPTVETLYDTYKRHSNGGPLNQNNLEEGRVNYRFIIKECCQSGGNETCVTIEQDKKFVQDHKKEVEMFQNKTGRMVRVLMKEDPTVVNLYQHIIGQSFGERGELLYDHLGNAKQFYLNLWARCCDRQGYNIKLYNLINHYNPRFAELGKRIQCNVELKKCEGSVQAHYEKICI
uniref:Uncharacterized protein n=1 Tax=Romanomermis culicivorax TaxID=13658 RepID=A0A915JGG5_ROMCU